MKLKFYTPITVLATSLRSTYIGLFCLVVGLLTATVSMGQTAGTLDNFTDLDIITNPVWTVATGTASATSGALVTNNTSTSLLMSTPFTTACQEWSLSVRSSNSFNSEQLRYYFILKDSPDPSNINADGYFLQYDGASGDFFIYKFENGAVVLTPILSFTSLTGNTNTHNVKITLSKAGAFQLFTSTTTTLSLRASGNDASFSSCLTQYQAIRVVENGRSDTYTIDNIAYVTWPCTNPADGGTIGNAQSQCTSFDPASFSELTAPSCYYGTLEYKWQVSNDGSTSGFTDIAGATASTYDPPAINQRSFYKRLSRVPCAVNPAWMESNVIPVYVSNFISGYPKDDTVYNQVGTAIFGTEVSILTGNTFQWQVSADAGSNWTNILLSNPMYTVSSPSNNKSFLNVAHPTFGMHLYQYRCVVTNSCGSIIPPKGATLYVLPWAIFSNTTPVACDSWNGSLEINVNVSNVGVLNSTTNVLRQINLKIGSSACKKDLSTYSFWITAPNGVTYRFVNGFTTTNNAVWADIKFRDHPALEKISEYTTNTQTGFHPYKIGYYAVENDNIFIPTFLGVDANGPNPWKLTITENDLASNGISFERVDLIFGPVLNAIDVTGISANNVCSNATCIGADGNIIVGTNNGYSANDLNYPGDVTSAGNVIGSTDGCGWNGANNNSAWFYFFASSSNAYITVSGLRAATLVSTSWDMQLIVLNGNQGCLPVNAVAPKWTVPAGGCADNEAVNNQSYLSTNGGGVSTAGLVYQAGITANAEFNLTGLTPGQRYYLYIDGNGNAASSFYIEATTGCQNCIVNSILSAKFLTFNAVLNNNRVNLEWQTGMEKDNDYFQIERSADGIHWLPGERIQGAGNSSAVTSYEAVDYHPLPGISYYRIKQMGYNEQVTYSEVRTVYNQQKGIAVFPNPTADVAVVSGLNPRISNTIRLVDATGKLVQEYRVNASAYRVDLSGKAPGIYFLIVNGTEHLQVVKTK